MLAVSYGCFIELMQLWLTKDRSADGLDALANTTGAALAVLVLWRIGKRKDKI
jgi:glycopeptide antibiotics resistance protein